MNILTTILFSNLVLFALGVNAVEKIGQTCNGPETLEKLTPRLHEFLSQHPFPVVTSMNFRGWEYALEGETYCVFTFDIKSQFDNFYPIRSVHVPLSSKLQIFDVVTDCDECRFGT